MNGSPPSIVSASGSTLPRRRWRQRLPWVISVAWSVLVLAMLVLSQGQSHYVTGGWEGSPQGGVGVRQGSLILGVGDNPGTRFHGELVGEVHHEVTDSLGPWYGGWDHRFHPYAEWSGAVPLLILLVPPWLWVAWLWWRRRRREVSE